MMIRPVDPRPEDRERASLDVTENEMNIFKEDNRSLKAQRKEASKDFSKSFRDASSYEGIDETTGGTNEKSRRMRRASMGVSKNDLNREYKAEKASVEAAYKESEEQFMKNFTDLQYEPVSGLAEAEEQITNKISLETFGRPKASRRSRRASICGPVRILSPISSPVKIEDVPMVRPSSPVQLPPFPFSSSSASLSINGISDMFDAESLAGWKTVTFGDGPLGILMQSTSEYKACRVQGFLDFKGKPSPAQSSGKINVGDVIVKVNGIVVKSYDGTIDILKQGGSRDITLRPGMSSDDFDSDSNANGKSKRKKKKKSEQGLEKESKKRSGKDKKKKPDTEKGEEKSEKAGKARKTKPEKKSEQGLEKESKKRSGKAKKKRPDTEKGEEKSEKAGKARKTKPEREKEEGGKTGERGNVEEGREKQADKKKRISKEKGKKKKDKNGTVP
jgi:hypothetical protein